MGRGLGYEIRGDGVGNGVGKGEGSDDVKGGAE